MVEEDWSELKCCWV